MGDKPIDLGAFRTNRELDEWRSRKKKADLQAFRLRRAEWLADELASAGADPSQIRETLTSVYGADVAAAALGEEL